MLGWKTIVFAPVDLHDVLRSALVAAGAQVRLQRCADPRDPTPSEVLPRCAQIVPLDAEIAKSHPERPWISQAARLTAAMLPNIELCDYLIVGDGDSERRPRAGCDWCCHISSGFAALAYLAVGPLSTSYFRDPLSNPRWDLHLHNAFHEQTRGQQQYPMVGKVGKPGCLVLPLSACPVLLAVLCGHDSCRVALHPCALWRRAFSDARLRN